MKIRSILRLPLALVALLSTCSPATAQNTVRVDNATGIVAYPTNLFSANAEAIADAASSNIDDGSLSIAKTSGLQAALDAKLDDSQASAPGLTILGAASAAAQRTALALVIGTDVQAYDADLDAFATKVAPSGVVVGTTDTQTLTNKAIDAGQLTGGIVAARLPAANATDIGAILNAGETTVGLIGTRNIVTVFEGDSVTDAAGSTGPTGCWPYHLLNDYGLFANAGYHNVATSGETAQAIVTQFTAQVHPYAPTGAQVGLYFLLAGTNDFGSRTAAQIYADLASSWALARADGFKVIAVTVPVNTNWSTVANANEIKRKAVNNLIRQNSANYDFLVDLDNLFNIPGTVDEITAASYFSDGIHPTELGNRKIAGEVFRVLVSNFKAQGVKDTIARFSRSAYFVAGAADLDYQPDYSKHPGIWSNEGGVCEESTPGFQGWQMVSNMLRVYGNNWVKRTAARPAWRMSLLSGGTADNFALSHMPSANSTETTLFTVSGTGAVTGGTYNGNTITTGTGTLTLAASSTLATSGANSITLTSTGSTNVTLPTTGTLATTAGNVATATALATPRTINGVNFNGTADITVPAAAGTLTGSTLASGVTASSLTSAAGGAFGTAAYTASSSYTSAPVAAPSTASSTGTAGTWSIDASYVYFCVSTNTWVRAPVATW